MTQLRPRKIPPRTGLRRARPSLLYPITWRPAATSKHGLRFQAPTPLLDDSDQFDVRFHDRTRSRGSAPSSSIWSTGLAQSASSIMQGAQIPVSPASPLILSRLAQIAASKKVLRNLVNEMRHGAASIGKGVKLPLWRSGLSRTADHRQVTSDHVRRVVIRLGESVNGRTKIRTSDLTLIRGAL